MLFFVYFRAPKCTIHLSVGSIKHLQKVASTGQPKYMYINIQCPNRVLATRKSAVWLRKMITRVRACPYFFFFCRTRLTMYTACALNQFPPAGSQLRAVYCMRFARRAARVTVNQRLLRRYRPSWSPRHDPREREFWPIARTYRLERRRRALCAEKSQPKLTMKPIRGVYIFVFGLGNRTLCILVRVVAVCARHDYVATTTACFGAVHWKTHKLIYRVGAKGKHYARHYLFNRT